MAGDMQADIPDSGAVFTYGRSRFANNVASYFFIRNDPIAAISCGDEHTAVVCQNGRVFAFGSNSWGQLGLGHKNTITMPSCIKSLKPEKANQIACGKSHTVISTVSGKVFTCGSNTDGQLGIPEVSEKTTPTQVTGIEVKPGGIKQVSAGCLHSACLTDDGKVYVWGSNTDGQLGLGDAVATADVPTLVNLPKPAATISCGYYHTAFVTDDGKLYICGEGENGKLGLSETGNVFTPTLVDIDSPIEFIACGGNHTIAITKNADVYGFGSNLNGQLGLGSKVAVFTVPQLISALTGKQIRSVACGESHTAFVSAKGHLFMCGDGRYGKLCKDVNSDAEDVSEYTPRQLERFDSYNVTLVACGGCHTMVQAATNTSDGSKGSPSRNDGVTLVLDRMEEKSQNQDLRAGDSVNPSPKSGRLPPLHVTPSRGNGSTLDSPSVEIAPESTVQIEQVNGNTPKNVIAVFETKDSDDGSLEGDENQQMNGGDTWRPNGESLDEVLQKLNVRDASDLENDVAAVEYEARSEIATMEETVDDKMAESGDTVVLSEMTKTEPELESKEETGKEGEEDKEKNGEEKSEGEGNVAPEVEIDLNENGEDKEDGENENEVVAAEQKNDAEAPKDAKTQASAEKGKLESRILKFLNTFKRKKLSEENVSLSPAWTTVDRRISSESTLVNNHNTDKPSVTNVKSGQPQRSKACVIV